MNIVGINSSQRYDADDEGFSDDEHEPVIIIEKKDDILNIDNRFAKIPGNKQSQPKYKLKFITNEKSVKGSLQNMIHNRQYDRKNGRSLDLKKKETGNTNQGKIASCIIKSKRSLIGQNLVLSPFAQQDKKSIKQVIFRSGQKVIFQACRQVNTHGFLRNFEKMKTPNFYHSKYNTLLRNRVKESFIMSKKDNEKLKKGQDDISFSNDIETGNLQIVSQVSESEFDLYLRIDTNTHGHQNWFYFAINNNSEAQRKITLNICNLKRDFKMINKGQKVFVTKIDSKKKQKSQNNWKTGGENIFIKENTNLKIARGKIYKLSFSITLQPNTQYEVATLPPYTYSNMLHFIQELQQKYQQIVDVDILTFSLTGLAIPIVTFTNKSSKNNEKRVILISSRIHPGESVGSYVAEGVMKKLVSQKIEKDFFDRTIIKIIPIINPDGVVFGNFRTNYLGIDLNRAFYTEDEILNPQIHSLKSLGRQLKAEYQQRFIYFLDLHGHSAKKNIFSYGPEYQHTDENYYLSRFLPKLLSLNSKYFKYSDCTFKLQEQKQSTARGFFLTQLQVMTYTIESSYSMYEGQGGNLKLMQVEDWKQFGDDLVNCIVMGLKLNQGQIKNTKELKKMTTFNEQQTQLIKRIKIDIKKEKKKTEEEREEEKDDSDGESNDEDLNVEEREQTEKKILQNCLPSYILPKVLKPTVLYPTVTPKLFEVNEQKEDSFKILYTKRNKYNSLRMANANTIYTNYIKNNLDQLSFMHPKGRNIKLEKKTEI